MAELVMVMTTIAVVAAAILEKTPDGVRVNTKRLEGAWQAISRKISASATRLHENERERNAASWRTVGVTESRIEEFENVWGKAPNGPQSLGYWRTALDCENQEATEWRRGFRKVEVCRIWKQAGVAAHDAQTWLGLDQEMNPLIASQWMNTGMHPEVAYSWHSRSYSPDKVGKLSAGGLLSYDNATELLIACADIGISFESIDFGAWVDAGFRDDITSVLSWISNNFTALEASPWHALHLDAKTSRSWVNAGFSASEAQFWVEHGFSIDVAKELFSLGFRGTTINPWRPRWHDVEFVTAWSRAGFTSSEDAQAWADHGFSPADAARWRDTNTFDPESAREWSKHQFSPDKATPWKTAGLKPEQSTLWIHHGASPTSVPAWFAAGFQDDITSVFSWMSSNFTAEEAGPWHALHLDAKTSRSWVDAGFSANEAQFWIENEFSVDSARKLFDLGFRGTTISPWRACWHDVEFVTEWSRAGFTSSEDAQAWADHGFSPADAARWRDTNTFDPESAREWSKHQFSPDIATLWKAAGISAERSRMWAERGIHDASSIRDFDSLLVEGGVARDIPKIIGQICERISRGEPSGQIEQFIFREFPAIGGDIGVKKHN